MVGRLSEVGVEYPLDGDHWWRRVSLETPDVLTPCTSSWGPGDLQWAERIRGHPPAKRQRVSRPVRELPRRRPHRDERVSGLAL